MAESSPLASVHSTNLPAILRQLGMSLAISTYQTGKLVFARGQQDGTLNTHFCDFQRPMGIAVDAQRLLIGTHHTLEEYRNVPAVRKRLEPVDMHDAAYVFRRSHVTGAIDVHELGVARDGTIYFVNTAFSCLCKLDMEHSFVPVWKPPFISGYAGNDRCHLNGLGMFEGEPRWLTALGAGNTAQQWRENKKSGGIVYDLLQDKILCDELSMPHSPRWHRDQLWALESGRGALVQIDTSTGKVHTVCQLPGFTRGLCFEGNLAFVGLSQLREEKAFTDIPITDSGQPRQSGVWVVDIDSGNTVALLQFEAKVQEIFAVEVVPAGFPALIEAGDEITASTYVLPDDALALVEN